MTTQIRNIRAKHIQKAIRARCEYNGAERTIIHHDGRVSAYGKMPNSNVAGWYFAGYAIEIMAEIHAEVAARA